ncbi:zincin-like metallopeptidase domain-containing protein [Megalodesulfovibrio paquesii]
MAGKSPKNASPKPPFHETFAAQITEDLQKGTAPWVRPWQAGTLHAPFNPVSGTIYKGINRVMLSRRGFEDPRWMTLNQANTLDCRVRKGEKSQAIVFWQFSKEEKVLDGDGKPVLGDNGAPLTQEVELARPIIRFSSVFHASQLDGDVPPFDPKTVAHDWDPHQKAEAILANSGAKILHNQRNRAFYSPIKDRIELPPREQFPAADGYYATALHELGHWTGHPSRLDREFGPFGSQTYAREELRAEIASWMLGQDLGIGHDPGQHLAYVDSWVSILKEDSFEIVRACRDAEKIKHFVMELEQQKHIETSQQTRPASDVSLESKISEKSTQAEPAAEKTFLAVPYRQKNQAKALGAKWDPAAKLWFAPAGADLAPLKPWLPEQVPAVEATLSPHAEFGQALREAGLDLGGSDPIMDGQIHRVPLLDGSSHKPDGAYQGHLDGVPAGFIQNHKTGEKQTWKATGHVLTPEQKAALQAEAAQRREARQVALQEQHARAAAHAKETFDRAAPASPEQAYLAAKGIPPLDTRMDEQGRLLVPGCDIDGKIQTLQTISPEGKRFEPGSRKQGAFFLIDPEGLLARTPDTPLCVAEGFATAASIHQATGLPTITAFDAGNLAPVAQALCNKYPNAPILFMADNDHALPSNVGLEKATRAAKAVGGKVLAPEFSAQEKARGLTDWNDLHHARGLEAMRKELQQEIAKAKTLRAKTQENGVEL